MAPGTCIKCDNDHNNRDHFVDLGFDLEFIRRNQQYDAPLLLCNACLTDILVTYAAKLPLYVKAQESERAQREENRDNLIQQLTIEINTFKARWEEAKKEIVRLTKVAQDKDVEISALGALDASLMKAGEPVNFETEEELNGPAENDGNDGSDSGSSESDDREPESNDSRTATDAPTVAVLE